MAPLLNRIKTIFSGSSKPSKDNEAKQESPKKQQVPITTVTPPTPLVAHPPTPVAAAAPPSTSREMAESKKQPVFDPEYVKVIYVLGGPGAGKGTQCARLVENLGFIHLSAGDLLRQEQDRAGSPYGEMIRTFIKEGTVVPMEVTIKLLENAMKEAINKRGKTEGGVRFLIDGFPRKMDQAIGFDETVCPSSLVLFLVCPEEELLRRLLKRGETSGRDDDNAESIKKRFKTFKETSMPVVDYYRQSGKVVDIDSGKAIDDVYKDIVNGLEPVLSGNAKGQENVA